MNSAAPAVFRVAARRGSKEALMLLRDVGYAVDE
jgi:hypothetical protein